MSLTNPTSQETTTPSDSGLGRDPYLSSWFPSYPAPTSLAPTTMSVSSTSLPISPAICWASTIPYGIPGLLAISGLYAADPLRTSGVQWGFELSAPAHTASQLS